MLHFSSTIPAFHLPLPLPLATTSSIYPFFSLSFFLPAPHSSFLHCPFPLSRLLSFPSLTPSFSPHIPPCHFPLTSAILPRPAPSYFSISLVCPLLHITFPYHSPTLVLPPPLRPHRTLSLQAVLSLMPRFLSLQNFLSLAIPPAVPPSPPRHSFLPVLPRPLACPSVMARQPPSLALAGRTHT